MPCIAPFRGVDRQPIHQAPVRQRGLHVERAGNDYGVYRGAFKLANGKVSIVKADRMPGVVVPALLFHERGR
jgi:hypothetical protein